MQFSAWNPNDPNKDLMMEVDFNDTYFIKSMSAVLAMLTPGVEDPIRGCRHYHDSRIEVKPEWARGKTPHATLFYHLFYLGIK